MRPEDKFLKIGELRAWIVQGGMYEARAIAAQIGDGAPWCFLAFGKLPAQRLVAVDERYFVVIGDTPDRRGSQFAVFDAVKRRRVSPAITHEWLIHNTPMVASRDSSRLFMATGREYKCWTLPSLDELWTVTPAPPNWMNVEAIAVREDDRLVVKGHDFYDCYDPDRSQLRDLIGVTSPDGATTEYAGFTRWKPKPYHESRKPFILAPDGAHLLRIHDGSLMLTDEAGATLQHVPMEVPESLLEDTLRRIHVRGMWEVWQTAPFKFLRRFPVRSASLFETLDERRRKDLRLAAWSLHWAARFYAVAPSDEWKPTDPSFIDRYPKTETFGVPDYLVEPLNKVQGEISEWRAEENEILLRFDDNFQRTASLEGALGPIEVAPPKNSWRQASPPPSIYEDATEFLKRAGEPEFKLAGADQGSAIAAIADLTKKVREDMSSLVWGNEQHLRFIHPGGEWNEEQFFDFVVTDCPGAVKALRDLLLAYDEHLEGEVWSDEFTSASGFPALALAKLDCDAWDALDGYFSRRDASHEPHGLSFVWPALAPFKSADAFQSGLRWLLDEEINGHGDDGTIARRLLRDARDALLPEEFFQEVQNAVAKVLSSNESANGRDTLLRPLAAAIDDNCEWDRRLRRLLK